MKEGPCSIEGCESKMIYAKGLCVTHYNRARTRKEKREESPAATPKKDAVAPDMKVLCLEAAAAIVERIKLKCRDNESADEIKILTEALSKVDNIVYAIDEK